MIIDSINLFQFIKKRSTKNDVKICPDIKQGKWECFVMLNITTTYT